MWPLILSLSAWAAPDRVVQTFDLGAGNSGLAISPDGRWVASLEPGIGQIHVLDTLLWASDTLDAAVCSESGPVSLAALDTDEVSARFYVGCEDGSVEPVNVEDGEDSPISVDTDNTVSVADGSAAGIVAGDGVLYVADDPGSDGALTLHLFDPDAGSVDDSDYYPVTLTMAGLQDMVFTGDYVVLLHGADNVSQVAVTTGNLLGPSEVYPSADCTDAEVSPDGLELLLACGDEGVMYYLLNDQQLLSTSDSGEVLVSPTALCIDAPDGEDASLLVNDSDGLLVFPYDAGGSGATDDLDSIVDLGGSSADRLQSAGGYTFALADGGELLVLSNRPWVEITAVDAAETGAVDGDTVTVTFTSDTSGEYALYVGSTDGAELASGSVRADEATDVSFTVGDDLAEGSNNLVLVVEADGLLGHDGETLTVNNPPSQVVLNDESLGFGNRQLTLQFEGIEDEDLDHYTVYVTTVSFSSEDYETGGPDYVGDDDVDYPEDVEADPGASVTLTLSPLTNDVTYYVAVRAWDSTGQEGPMSTVVSESPEETYAVSEITGEKGGFCGLMRPISAGLALLSAGLVSLRRRALPAAAALVAAGAMGGVAHADDRGFRDNAPRGSASLRYGPLWFAEDNPILDQFTDEHQVLWVEGGPSLWGLLNLNLGVGWYQEMGWLIGTSGSLSDEHDMLTALPFTLGLTARLDVLKEQPLVPYVSVGGDYWLWKENWYVSQEVGGDDHLGGGKSGWHWSVGAQLLLDSFEPARASLLEARKGIKDTYLTADYRVQSVGGEGIDFSARSLTLGLQMNY